MKATAKYYNSPQGAASKAKKDAYNTAYNKSDKATAKRVELNTANRKSQAAGKTKIGDGKDLAHTSKGLVSQPQSKNRGSKSAQPGDRRARGGKK